MTRRRGSVGVGQVGAGADPREEEEEEEEEVEEEGSNVIKNLDETKKKMADSIFSFVFAAAAANMIAPFFKTYFTSCGEIGRIRLKVAAGRQPA